MDGYNFRIFRNNPHNTQSIGNNFIRCIAEGGTNTLYIGTDAGLYIMNTIDESFSKVTMKTDKGIDVTSAVNALHVDKNGNVWIGSMTQGIFIYNPKGQSLKAVELEKYHLGQNAAWSIISDKSGTIWVGTRLGLLRYNANTEKLEAIEGMFSTQDNSKHEILCILDDDKGNLWLGTWDDGMRLYNKQTNEYISLYGLDSRSYYITHVRSIFQYTDKSLLIGSDDGLYLFDLEKDSRFWKSFRTKYSLNNSTTAPNLNMEGANTYTQGDLGLIYIINKKDDTRFSDPTKGGTALGPGHSGTVYVHPETGKRVPHTYVRYFADGSSHVTTIKHRFPSISKHFDGSRETVAWEPGNRDGIIARSADAYLTKAEALIRQNKYAEAIEVINVVRRRAQFADGEDRAKYWDGGGAYYNNTVGQAALAANGGINCNAFREENSYYESLQIPETTAATDLTNYTAAALPPEDEAIISTLGLTSEYDRMMAFLLNERTRELIGEFHRWEDLSRTKTLLKRTQTFNLEEGARTGIAEHNYLRPIPQTFLDQIQNADGRALTPEEKQAMQNPGY